MFIGYLKKKKTNKDMNNVELLLFKQQLNLNITLHVKKKCQGSVLVMM